MKKKIILVMIASLMMLPIIKNSNTEAKVRISILEETAAAETTPVEETKEEETKAEETPTQQIPSIEEQLANQRYQASLAAQQAAEQEALIASQQQQIQELISKVETVSTPTSIQGWWKLDINFWYYYEAATGKPLRGRFLDWGGNTYYFDGSGHMVTEWSYIDASWYYFGKTGEMKKGWLELEKDVWYYLDPETGKMQMSDRVIDGVLYNFGTDGKWIQNVNQLERGKLVDRVKGLVRYVDTRSKLKKIAAPGNFKKQINDFIEELPKDVLARMAANLEAIYFCMEQKDQAKDYIQSVGYIDEDGERYYEELPFAITLSNIFLDGSNPYYFYYGLGNWLGRQITIMGQPMYSSQVWKAIHADHNEEITSMQGFSYYQDYRMAFYISSPEVTLACSIGWFLIDPQEVKETNLIVYKFLTQYIDRVPNSGGPGEEYN